MFKPNKFINENSKVDLIICFTFDQNTTSQISEVQWVYSLFAIADDNIPSQSVCIQVDRGLTLWSPQKSNVRMLVDNMTHISTVDTVKLLQVSRPTTWGLEAPSLLL